MKLTSFAIAAIVAVSAGGPLLGATGTVTADHCAVGLALVASGGSPVPEDIARVPGIGAWEEGIGNVGEVAPVIRDAVSCARQCDPRLLYGVEGGYTLGVGVVLVHATCGWRHVAECVAETLARQCSSGRLGTGSGTLGCHWHVLSGVQTGKWCNAYEPPIPIPLE